VELEEDTPGARAQDMGAPTHFAAILELYAEIEIRIGLKKRNFLEQNIHDICNCFIVD